MSSRQTRASESTAPTESSPRRLIVAMTGATGQIYGVRLLEKLQGSGIETHLVMSRWAARTLVYETDYTPTQVQALASRVHPLTNQGAAISSGSFVTEGMVVTCLAFFGPAEA